MQTQFEPLGREEQVTLALRGLYECYGYKKFRMSRFEEYDFYAKNRDFLPHGQIIAFTGLDGRLMALRPDVTLSIVRQADGSADSDRLYYTEPVYRPAHGSGEYRECYQVGIEHIGKVTPYACMEVVSIAAQSLEIVDPNWVLALSHTAYVGGLLAALPFENEEARQAVRRCIEQKNTHELAAIVSQRLPEEDVARLTAVARLSGTFDQTLEKARALAKGEEMLAAVGELEALWATLSACIDAARLRLDFSITSDAKYYSGLMLRGYIRGVPGAALSGGRYDPLLKRMGKPYLSAMGFALYFDELARFLSAEADDRVETVLLYGPDSNPVAVAKAVQACVARGERVWAGTEPPRKLTWGKVVEVDGHA